MNYQIYLNKNKVSKPYLEAIKEYEKRLSKYCKVEIIYCKDQSQLSKKLKPNTYTIQLITSKESIDSVTFSNTLDEYGIYGTSDISFLIGFDVSTDDTLAISQMNFSDELLLITLLEQIYRAYRILKNEPYHK